MLQSFELNQFPDLPPEAVKVFVAQAAALESARFEASVERAARQHERAVVAEKVAFTTELKDLIQKPEGQVRHYRQAKFGPKSERLDPAQLELAREELETSIAETQPQIAAVEDKIAASANDPEKAAHMHRAKQGPSRSPATGRARHRIPKHRLSLRLRRHGPDRTERLDFILTRYQVIITIRPKYAGLKGRTGAVQAKALAHLLEGRWPAEAPFAQIAIANHSEHMPLNRPSLAVAPLGGPIERSVLTDWIARTGALIAPVIDCMAVPLKSGNSRHYVDETTAPVLGPGRVERRPAISVSFCAMTGAGMAPPRRAPCSTTIPAEKANMPIKS